MRWRSFVRASVVVAAAICGLVPARAAHAQVLELPEARQGYFLSVGPHFTMSKVWMDGERYGVWPGYEVGLHFGQMVTRRFGLGLQVHTGAGKGDAQTAATFGLELEAQWALRPRLAVHASAGVDTFSVRADDGKDKSLRGAAGSGYSLGLSYSWFFTHHLSGGWALTPRIDARLVPGSDTKVLVGVVGFEIAWWSGLPRNQLELPSSEAYKVKKK
jgi:hypothetical protein